jgi:hypothetical protein
LFDILEPQDFLDSDINRIWQTMLGNMMMVDNQDPSQERLRIVAQTIKRMAPLTETYFKD